jgi:hypothetical protein
MRAFGHRSDRAAPSAPHSPGGDPFEAAAHTHARRVRRLKINLVAWALGVALLTALWVVSQWRARGAFERFGNDGNPGDWSPTLWALAVGVWTLVVGIMALRVSIARPATRAEVERELARQYAVDAAAPAHAEIVRLTRARIENVRRLRFHVASWVLGMILLTPLWALIEWQDNGSFERWSNDSRPGDWDPWILTVGGIWALVIAMIAVPLLRRPAQPADTGAPR